MIRLLIPAGAGPHEVRLLAQDGDGEEVDIIKAGNVSSIRLRVEPDEPPVACGTFPPFTGEGIFKGNDDSEHG